MSLGEVNYLAVVVAALAPMVIGAMWYGPVFGKIWIKAHGYDQEKLAEMQAGMGKAYGLSFVCYLVMALVMALLIAATGWWETAGGIHTGLICWLGFAATIGLTAHLFSDKKPAAYLLDAGFQLVYMVAMGIVLASWP